MMAQVGGSSAQRSAPVASTAAAGRPALHLITPPLPAFPFSFYAPARLLPGL